MQLLAGLLGCCEREVGIQLGVHSTSTRVAKVSQQVFDKGKHLVAGSLLLTSQVFMSALQTVPSVFSVLNTTFKERNV